ncbi:MAG: HEAT repeat domain-containing protein [Mycobacteriaceae bacterium]|uniref:HEAT repeat domain-containing protein n=1 Tax=Corynebacterium sp. TaxID=1720 RepID=UPI003F999C41
MNRLTTAFSSPDASVRMRASLAAGTDPQVGDLTQLITQCREEPDFFVRDMLTWALTRHDPARVVPLLLQELDSPANRARSQALHTLSKIGDTDAYPYIIEHLQDEDAEVARTAWRAATGLAPDEEKASLADVLTGQLGRGDREIRRSLSRAFLELGEYGRPALEANCGVHARATLLILDDPGLGFDAAEYEARQQAPN